MLAPSIIECVLLLFCCYILLCMYVHNRWFEELGFHVSGFCFRCPDMRSKKPKMSGESRKWDPKENKLFMGHWEIPRERRTSQNKWSSGRDCGASIIFWRHQPVGPGRREGTVARSLDDNNFIRRGGEREMRVKNTVLQSEMEKFIALNGENHHRRNEDTYKLGEGSWVNLHIDVKLRGWCTQVQLNKWKLSYSACPCIHFLKWCNGCWTEGIPMFLTDCNIYFLLYS